MTRILSQVCSRISSVRTGKQPRKSRSHKPLVPTKRLLFEQCEARVLMTATPNVSSLPASNALRSEPHEVRQLQSVSHATPTTTPQREVIVAVLDSGSAGSRSPDAYFQNMSEIADNSLDDDGNGYTDDVSGYDFVHASAHVGDDNGHGALMESVIRAKVAELGRDALVKILPLKVADEQGHVDPQRVTSAVTYATHMGASVILTSFGVERDDAAMHQAFIAATHAGVVIVAAAGNTATNIDSQAVFPAAYASTMGNVIAVAATTSDATGGEHLASYSSFGSRTVTAPGDVRVTLAAHDQPVLMQGTSIAAARVAGVLAAQQAQAPALSMTVLADKLFQLPQASTADRKAQAARESKLRTQELATTVALQRSAMGPSGNLFGGLGGLIKGLTGALGGIFDSVGDALGSVFHAAEKATLKVWEGAEGALKTAINMLTHPDAVVKGVVSVAKAFVHNPWQTGKAIVQQMWKGMTQDPLLTLGSVLANAGIAQLGNALLPALPSLPSLPKPNKEIQAVLDMGKSLTSGIGKAFSTLTETFVGAFQTNSGGNLLKDMLHYLGDTGPMDGTGLGCGAYGTQFVPDRLFTLPLSIPCANHDQFFKLITPRDTSVLDQFVINMKSNGNLFVDIMSQGLKSGDPVAMALSPFVATVYTSACTGAAIASAYANGAARLVGLDMNKDKSWIPTVVTVATGVGIIEAANRLSDRSIANTITSSVTASPVMKQFKPSAPTNVQVTASNRGQVTVKFTDVPLATKYTVEVSYDNGRSWTKQEDAPAGSGKRGVTFNAKGKVPPKVRVIAFTGTLASAPSKVV